MLSHYSSGPGLINSSTLALPFNKCLMTQIFPRDQNIFQDKVLMLFNSIKLRKQKQKTVIMAEITNCSPVSVLFFFYNNKKLIFSRAES